MERKLLLMATTMSVTTAKVHKMVDLDVNLSEGGEILCCDNCFRSFHLECVGLKTEPKGDWICPYCRDLQESKLAECPKCEKDLDEIGKHEKVSCAKCLRK